MYSILYGGVNVFFLSLSPLCLREVCESRRSRWNNTLAKFHGIVTYRRWWQRALQLYSLFLTLLDYISQGREREKRIAIFCRCAVCYDYDDFFFYTSFSFIRRWIWLLGDSFRRPPGTSIVWDGGRRIHHLNRWRHYTQCEFRCSSRSTHHWSRQLHYLRSLMYIFQFSNGSWILKFSVRDYLFIYLLASQFLGVDGWLTFIG